MSLEKTTALDVVRVFNKHLLNPLVLRLAGRRHIPASVIYHAGRRSWKAYRTPVVAEPVNDGFVVPLPYGERVDWVRNLMAHHIGSVEHDGQMTGVRNPTIVRADEALAYLTPQRRRAFERLGVRSFMRLDTTPR
jgi:deazaflavin-dependent oxidoreductase (nitroreductase family)